MSKPIIEVKGISKRYKLGTIGAKTMRDEVEAFFSRFKKTKPPATSHSLPAASSSQPLVTRHSSLDTARSAEFWALRDVSFDVQPGEVVGIIGRNGAGKSTLLKILSRITEPTSGEIRVRGRIASLLEVGTGFHPELSGRENIFLNGAILGMSKAEIRAKFDEIVDFAGVEQFIDTPVKRYSSGMYVRLAFAVAAHLEPEILIVDEVLAVGDAEFQKKCLGKMNDVACHGRTILFVSHNMDAVSELCGRALLIEAGTVRLNAPTRDVVTAYLSRGESAANVDLDILVHDKPQRCARLTSLKLLDGSGALTTSFRMNEPLVAHIGVSCHKAMKNAEIGLKISSRSGSAIHYLTSTWEGFYVDLKPGNHTFEVRLPHIMLLPGSYAVGLWVLSEPDWSDDALQDVTTFTVLKGDVTGHRTRFEQYAFSGSEVHAPSSWAKVDENPHQ